jgi:acetylglutamate kinase
VERLRSATGEDLGHVGTPTSVDPRILQAMTGNGVIPVVAPVGTDAAGDTFNVNADVAAGAIAQALGAEKLILLTDVEGVLDADGRLRARLTIDQAEAAIAEGSVKGGMIPKLECAVQATEHDVHAAHIIDGRVPHALLLEIFTDGGVGTVVVSD